MANSIRPDRSNLGGDQAAEFSADFSFPFGSLSVSSNVESAIVALRDKFRYYPMVGNGSNARTMEIIHARRSREYFDHILAKPSRRVRTGAGDFIHISTTDRREYLWWPPNMMVDFTPEDGSCGRVVVAHGLDEAIHPREADRLRVKADGDEFDWELVADIAAGAFARDAGRVLLHAGMFRWKGASVMIGGESGAGKTTACLSMLRAGAKYAADDLCALGMDPSGHGVLCAGLLTPPNFVGQAPATLEELEAGLAGNGATWKSRGHAALESFMEAQPMADTTPTMVVILEKTDHRPPEHRFDILEEAEALEQIMGLLIDPSNVSRREFHLEIAIALLAQAVVVRATLAPHINSLPEVFEKMLLEAKP
ncbi:MAG: hypothetical protein OEZ32_02530 [Nitrospinota bacterium]|nr:hypothetical protein [Nitrospinota bacterium]